MSWISVFCMAGATLFGCCDLSAEDVAAPCNSGAGAPPKMRALSLTETSEALCDVVDPEDIDSLYEDSPLPSSPDIYRQRMQPSTSSASGLDTPALDEAECDWYAKLPADLWDIQKGPCLFPFILLVTAGLKIVLKQQEDIRFLTQLFACKSGIEIQSRGFVWANSDSDPDCVYRKKVLISMLLHYKKYFEPGLVYAVLAYDASLLEALRLSPRSWLGEAVASCHTHMLVDKYYSLVECEKTPPDKARRATERDCAAFFLNEVELRKKRRRCECVPATRRDWKALRVKADSIWSDESRRREAYEFIALLQSRAYDLERAAFFADSQIVFSVVLCSLGRLTEYAHIFAALMGSL